MRSLGIILIVVGIILMVITGINLVSKEKVVDMGRLEVSKEERTPVRWSPIIGGVILAAGIVVLLTGKKRIA